MELLGLFYFFYMSRGYWRYVREGFVNRVFERRRGVEFFNFRGICGRNKYNFFLVEVIEEWGVFVESRVLFYVDID